jgi:hypothetical protein
MARRPSVRHQYSKLPAEESMPTGIAVAAGSVVVVVSAFVSAAVPASAGVVRLGLVAAALAGFAALTVNVNAAVAVGILAFLVFEGFLVNQLGELSWHGIEDVWRLLTLAAAAGLGIVVGVAYRALGRWRMWARWSEELAARPGDGALPRDEQPSRNKATGWNKKETGRG